MSHITFSVCFVILIVTLSIIPIEARVTADACKINPTKKRNHCNIESASRLRIPHTIRYAWNWNEDKCFTLYWWTDAQRCTVAPEENNFDSERACYDACSGWKKKK